MAEHIEFPSEHPGPDQLAGVYIRIEGEERSFVESSVMQPVVDVDEAPPTIEQLAGVNLRLEGNEKDLCPPSGPPEILP